MALWKWGMDIHSRSFMSSGARKSLCWYDFAFFFVNYNRSLNSTQNEAIFGNISVKPSEEFMWKYESISRHIDTTASDKFDKKARARASPWLVKGNLEQLKNIFEDFLLVRNLVMHQVFKNFNIDISLCAYYILSCQENCINWSVDIRLKPDRHRPADESESPRGSRYAYRHCNEMSRAPGWTKFATDLHN